MDFSLGAGAWIVRVSAAMPRGLDARRVVVDTIGDDASRPAFFALVARAASAPSLLVVGRFRPDYPPGLHIVAETNTLLVGCGESLAAYDLTAAARTHLDVTPYSFRAWARHNDVVIMCGELEVAGYDLSGRRLWAATIDPPWNYGVDDATMFTIAAGHRTEFPLRSGRERDGPQG
jgi:hypothetical protein